MLSDETAFFESAFKVLNKVYFEGDLPEVVITIQSTPRVYGHITVQKIWTGNTEENYLREINIGADYLDRPIEAVMATLLHEMVHLYCAVENIKDTSNGGRYHNKKFKQEAEKRDLSIEFADYIGWSVTSPTEKFVEVLKTNGLYVELGLFRKGGAEGGGEKPRKKSSTRKYICPNCKISVRATKNVNILCLDCGVALLKDE